MARDELQKYLEDTDVPRDCDEDILKCWRVREIKWPSLAKMVKHRSSSTFFAAPASSAGVERVFSAAGK